MITKKSNLKTNPGRPRSFDRDDVLDQIIDLFWEKGFKGTTVPDIEKATGLHRQSLIYAFGDKHKMFVEALKRYGDRHCVKRFVDVLGRDGSPSQNIRAAFDLWIDDAKRKIKTGCLLVNTAGEFGNTDSDIAIVIGANTDKLAAAFTGAFTRAQEEGEIGTELAPNALAHLAVACGDGALLQSRAAKNPAFAKTSFNAFIAKILN